MRKSWRNASSTEHATQQRNIASSRLRSIHSTNGVPSMTNLRALKSAKYTIAVSDAPHQRAPKRRKTAMYRNENMRREIHIMIVPHVKAMTTERSMADIIPIARVVLMNSPMSVSSSWGCVAIL